MRERACDLVQLLSPYFSKMAADRSRMQNIVENVVENVVNHPEFRSLVSGVQTQPSSSITSTTTSTTSTSSSTTFSPIQEFNSIFRRGASTGQQQQGAGTVSSFSPGIGTYTARSRARSSSRGRRQNATSTCTTTARSKASTFTREVVLLSSPEDRTVLRGKAKAELMRRGQVISSFDFNRSWTEDDVYRHLRQAFGEKLQGARYISLILTYYIAF